MNGEVLNSWKEIAEYMGRGVRTVQRWEQELGLPVRRPRGKDRSAVLALKPELDRWLHNTPHGSHDGAALSESERHAKLHITTEQLLKRTQEILEHSTRVQEAVRTTLALTSRMKERQAGSMRARRAQAQNHMVVVNTAAAFNADHKRGGGRPTSWPANRVQQDRRDQAKPMTIFSSSFWR
jgi:phage terminase Nu1 subunit (DNA packaging protein)